MRYTDADAQFAGHPKHWRKWHNEHPTRRVTSVWRQGAVEALPEPEMEPVRRAKPGERLPDEYERWLVGYAPVVVDADRWHQQIKPFLLPMMRKLSYNSFDSMKRSTRELMKLTDWCLSQGDALDIEVILDPEKVESYTQTMLRGDRSGATYRSVLRALGPLLTTKAPWVPRPKPVGRRSIGVPYLPSEVAALRQEVRLQATPANLRAGRAILALGLGAGLDGRWNTKVGATDVIKIGTPLVVRVGEPKPRHVPVLAEWEDEVTALALEAGDEPLIGPALKGKDAANVYASRIRLSEAAPVLNAGRLRTTWLVHHIAAGSRLPDLAHAAGLQTFEVFSDLMAYVYLLPEAERNLLLRNA